MIIVYAYVCGDILHKGHIEHLKNCKALGDKLIVGVLTDKAIMEKKSKPTLNFDERFDLIRSLEMVDIVVTQNEYLPIENIKRIKPDVLVESSSHEYIDKNYLRLIKNLGIRIIILPYYFGHSSTKIKNKVKKEGYFK